ncbi:hydroxyproline-rich glycoprotein family protein [Zea mays]|uniref:Hydroxyproline-rich glycoprotein family protein n=1 Tax=Zea mays TaxID=4577 RepID=A0A1D6PE44_MAIZE|nr:hydroxyproline-rich glycoprotein family protein [Zea mays]
MDREWGSKPGSGGAASAQNEAIDRRERLRRLALETIDLAKDPYFMRNHLGSYECKLCLTLHNNEGNYLAHTQGKRHQTNLAKRAAREAKDAPAQPQPNKRKLAPRKSVKIGRPGYKVTKQYDPEMKQHSFLFEIGYPEIEDNCKPRHRFMSSYEQSKVGIRVISTYFLLQSPMKLLHSRYQVQRLINQRTNSSLTGILTRRNIYCNCTSSQDRQKLINHHQLLRGLCLMGLGFLVLQQGHRRKPLHPCHKFHRPRLMHLLLHPWECPLGFLHPLWVVFNLRRLLHRQLQMVRGQ